mmetsp:Transcript_12774/g.35041  ORF Transcript_12774/g.35041 Transcript_12774/m.35041 type:complete len:167 (-) Transcript_12774:23-523(-)
MLGPLEDSFHASNWGKSTPTGFRMNRTTDAYLPNLWDREANAAWCDRVRKEKENLGLHIRPFGGIRSESSARSSPVVVQAADFVPRQQGPLMRYRQRHGATSYEYGSFHLVEDRHATMSRHGVVRNTGRVDAREARQAPQRSSSLPGKAGPLLGRLERLEAHLLCK